MWHQGEVERRIRGESIPSTDVSVGTAAHRRWVVLAIALIVTVVLLASGIWSRIQASKTLRTDTSQVAVTSVSVVSPK